MENKSKFLNEISPCGDIPYITLVEIINQLVFDDDQIKIFLLKRLAQNKNFIISDWKLIFLHVEYENGFDRSIPLGWLNSGCKITGDYFKLFLEYVKMQDFGSTYLLTENGEILIAE